MISVQLNVLVPLTSFLFGLAYSADSAFLELYSLVQSDKLHFHVSVQFENVANYDLRWGETKLYLSVSFVSKSVLQFGPCDFESPLLTQRMPLFLSPGKVLQLVKMSCSLSACLCNVSQTLFLKPDQTGLYHNTHVLTQAKTHPISMISVGVPVTVRVCNIDQMYIFFYEYVFIKRFIDIRIILKYYKLRCITLIKKTTKNYS